MRDHPRQPTGPAWFVVERGRGLRVAILLGLLAIGVRALLVGVVLEQEGCRLDEFARSADGPQVLAVAEAWRGETEELAEQAFVTNLREQGAFSSSHLIRFLPASPGLVALAREAGLSTGWAATLPFWLLAGVAVACLALWSGDLRPALAVALLPPIQLYASSFLAHEPWYFLTTAACLAFASREKWALAGLALGLSMWGRPEGLLLGASVAVAALWCSRVSRLVPFLVASLSAIAAGAALVFWRFGPFLRELGPASSASDGGPPIGFFAWPGSALVEGIAASGAPAWKAPYVVAHLAVALACAVLAIRSVSRKGEAASVSEVAISLWIPAHLLLLLSLRGGQGYDDLPRYIGLIAVALALAAKDLLPRSRLAWGAIGIASLLIAFVPASKNARPECGGGARESGWYGGARGAQSAPGFEPSR